MGKAYTKNVLKKQLKNIPDKTSKRKIDNNPEIASYKTFKKYFGDSLNSKIAINESPKRYNLTKDKMLNLIREKAANLGRTPTKREVIEDKNIPDPNVYVYLFGSWKNAIISAGLTPNSAGKPRKNSDRL